MKCTKLKKHQKDLFTWTLHEVGAFYNAHSDYHVTIPRRISFIYGLNDDYEGGELHFHFPDDDNSKIKIKSNSLIIFPSNHLFVHSVAKVTKGVRYEFF